jgi:hypothetical protein
MIVQLGRVTLKFKWEHRPQPDQLCTFCHVQRKLSDGTWEPITAGIAWCSPNDTYDKNVGRKVSLNRALHAAGFELDYGERSLVWNSYRQMRGGKW